MPLKKCSNDGKSGYKWGDSGTCYTGPGARRKALKQGQAIEINKKNRGEASEYEDVTAQLNSLTIIDEAFDNGET